MALASERAAAARVSFHGHGGRHPGVLVEAVGRVALEAFQNGARQELLEYDDPEKTG